jgi:hypothetical protein
MIPATRNRCITADSNVLVAGSPMGDANVIPRRCTLARLVLSFPLTISILSLGLFMTSFSGCVLPVGPRFEDPPATENVPPYIKTTMPVQGSIVTAVNRAQTFSVTFTDLNADALQVRWLGEYPPFNLANTRLMQTDKDVPAPLNGQPVDTSQPITVSCGISSLALTNQHAITVLISDQPFWKATDPDAPTDPEQFLTQNRAKSVMAQASWVLNLPCP